MALDRLLGAALARPRAMLAAWIAAGLLAAPGLLLLESDNSPQVFFLSGARAVATYQEFRSTFGGDDALRVALRGPRLWRQDSRAWLRDVERRLAALPGVERALGPWNAGPPGGPTPAAREDPLLRNLGLVGPHGDVATVLLLLAPGTPHAQRALLQAVERTTAAPPPGVTVSLVGPPVLNRALDRESRAVGERYFPALVALAVVLLLLAFRRPRSVALSFLFVAWLEVLLLGPMGYFGVRLNMVLAVLPPLVFVIALATAVHLQVRFHDHLERGVAAGEAVRRTFAEKGRAVLWTSVTTLVGFGSLLSSPIGPVRALGGWCLIATLEMILAVFTLYPALLDRVGGGPGEVRRRAEAALARHGRDGALWAARHRGALATLLALITIAAGLGLPRLRVEGNALTYLRAGAPARAGIEALERAGVGVSAVELLLREGAGSAGLRSGSGLRRLAWLAIRLREEVENLGVFGAGDVVDVALRRSAEGAAAMGGDAPRQAALERLEQDASGRAALAAYLDADGRAARVTIFVPTVGVDRLAPILAAARRIGAEEFPEARVETTGQFPTLLETQGGLLRTLASSLGLTLASVAAIFYLLLRSARWTPLALVPSLLPVLVVLGAMGWLGVPLDIATVMIASILLGLAGDDTIHTVDRFRELEPAQGPRAAIATALEENAPAYLLTALIRTAGFAVCALASFVPIERFGVLCATAIVIAAIADLVLVPALLAGPQTARARPAAEPS